MQWDLDIDDVYDENDPINGTELTAYLTLSCRKKQDAKILGTFTVNYAYSDGPVSYDTATHIEHRHRLRVNYTKDTLQDYVICNGIYHIHFYNKCRCRYALIACYNTRVEIQINCPLACRNQQRVTAVFPLAMELCAPTMSFQLNFQILSRYVVIVV